MEHVDVLIVDAGAAGIAAAKAAAEDSCCTVLLVDQNSAMGGILLQCAHRGFSSALTGPEYVEKLLVDFPDCVNFCPDTTVLSVSRDRTAVLAHRESGRRTVAFRQLILATGCLEIPMGALPIAGTRPAGIFTAGQMQAMMNLHGHIPEGPAVILGSGDLGLIMAGHLAEAGVTVAALVEQKPVCGGLSRNRKNLQLHPIPLHCSTTIQEVRGYPRLEAVVLSNGTEIPCKTLLIAAGLRPDQTLIRGLKTEPWLHLCGNCSRVHPMVEAVTEEGHRAGILARSAIRGAL